MKKTLLLVEDDIVFRSRLSRAFEKRSLLVTAVASFAEFHDQVSSRMFDYAVIDLRIGSSSGLDVLDDLLAAQPECRAVILTGYGTIASTVRAMKSGAVDFLTKPTDPDTILEVLEQRQPSVMSDAVPVPTLAQSEWEHIQRVLRECDGNVSTAAKVLGLHRRTLQRKLAKDPTQLD